MSNIDSTIVTAVITDLTTNAVTSTVELPEHLHHWTVDAIAEWAVERDDITNGRKVEIDHTAEMDYYGLNEWSYVMYYRAGGRYQVALSVAYVGRVFTVTYPDGDTVTHTDEDLAVVMAESIEGSVLGTATMVL